jgi:hypothetical protein
MRACRRPRWWYARRALHTFGPHSAPVKTQATPCPFRRRKTRRAAALPGGREGGRRAPTALPPGHPGRRRKALFCVGWPHWSAFCVVFRPCWELCSPRGHDGDESCCGAAQTTVVVAGRAISLEKKICEARAELSGVRDQLGQLAAEQATLCQSLVAYNQEVRAEIGGVRDKLGSLASAQATLGQSLVSYNQEVRAEIGGVSD